MISERNKTELDAAVDADAIEALDADDIGPLKKLPAAEQVSLQLRQRAYRTYVFVPFLLLTVTLLGGVRIGMTDNQLIFVRPALVCLIFALFLLALFFRAGLIRSDGWFSDNFTTLKNMANGGVLLSLFAASTQVFNSLLPERGLPFWVVAFCFFWVLWSNLFAGFDVQKLLRSLAALFGLAFVVKYLLLANLTAPGNESWLRAIWENPGKEAVTWLLDLPRYSSAGGYLQFFSIVIYGVALYLFPSGTADDS